jgi:hypothetical protein
VEEAGSFEEWAAALSYDPDSRHAERIYRSARRRARSLRHLIGEQSYRGLLRESLDDAVGIDGRAAGRGARRGEARGAA